MKRIQLEELLAEEVAALEKKKYVAILAGFVCAVNDRDLLAMSVLKSLNKFFRIREVNTTCGCDECIGHPYE